MAQLSGAVPLPPEILQHIVRHLDPIALIALSQACRAWRAFINPIRHDHVQRLLALELLPEHGGITPHFDEYYQKLTPPWESDEWSSVKYACCGCMRLRTHMMFDNHSILRRPYRKPSPGFAEAGRAAVTEWEPFEPRVRWRRIQERAARAQEERKRWVRVANWRSDFALTNPPAHPFENRPLPPNELDYEAEKYLIGTSRHRRRCLECQRRNGHWRRPNVASGYLPGWTLPMAASRHLKFSSPWERFFPGFLDQLPPEKYPRYWRAIQESVDCVHLSLYVAHCSTCRTWQDIGAFREWTLSERRRSLDNEFTIAMICTHCHLKTYNAPAFLAHQLALGLAEMLEHQVKDAAYRLGFGWKWIEKDLVGMSSKHEEAYREVLDGLPWKSTAREEVVVDESTIPDLRRRFFRYRDLVYNEMNDDTRSRLLHSWFRLWFEEYELLEGFYFWLRERMDRVLKEPKLVLDYVLERDPYRVEGPVRPFDIASDSYVGRF